MKFFADTAIPSEIAELNSYGLLDGVTTNPSLIAKSGRDMKEVVAEICAIVDGPVSAEVASKDHATMLAEAHCLAKLADNVVVKLPLTMDGLQTCRALTAEGIQTNVTLCFSANQALLAAKVGASYISPFVGRLDDINLDGLGLIRDIHTIYRLHGFATEILAASIRTPNHIRAAALTGADVVTVPPAVIRDMVNHPLTDKGLAQFEADWAATGQSIL